MDSERNSTSPSGLTYVTRRPAEPSVPTCSSGKSCEIVMARKNRLKKALNWSKRNSGTKVKRFARWFLTALLMLFAGMQLPLR